MSMHIFCTCTCIRLHVYMYVHIHTHSHSRCTSMLSVWSSTFLKAWTTCTTRVAVRERLQVLSVAPSKHWTLSWKKKRKMGKLSHDDARPHMHKCCIAYTHTHTHTHTHTLCSSLHGSLSGSHLSLAEMLEGQEDDEGIHKSQFLKFHRKQHL